MSEKPETRQNTRPHEVKRLANGYFEKGVSGNPGGRPKGVEEVQRLARQHTPEAIRTLAKIAKSGKSESAQVMAANSLLERGWGKPVQPTEISGPNGGPIQTQQVEDPRVPLNVFLAEWEQRREALDGDGSTKH